MNALYVHVPFCKKKCHYCSFYSVTCMGRIGPYIKAIQKEACYYSSLYPGPYTSLYLGGGTPSILSPDNIIRLLGILYDKFSFNAPEITIEINPGTVSMLKLSTCRKLGVNRVSIGVQSFIDNELMMLGRIHTAREAATAVKMARDAGISNISIDLMIGIACQTKRSLESSICRAAEMEVDHISAYMLHPEPGTLLDRQLQDGRISIPDEDEQADMYECAIDILAGYGYEQYEISNFARLGMRSRHNLSYWNYQPFLGLGPAATSMHGDKRWTRSFDLERYITDIPGHNLEEEALTKEIQCSEALIMGLRKLSGINIERLSRRFGIKIADKYSDALKFLQDKGLIEISGNIVKLSRKGLLLGNLVFERFLPDSPL